MNRYQCSMVISALLISAQTSGNFSAVDERELQHTLGKTLQQFKKKSSESSLEQLLCLLEAELKLVEYLQTDVTGTSVEDACTERDRLLAYSVPSVVYLYHAIMDVATYSPLLTPDNSYLTYRERTTYFERMHHLLEDYYQEFQTLQHRHI